MKGLSTTGRILYALPFGLFGIIHLISGARMAGYVPSFIPGGAFWIYLTGIAFLAACISILIQKKVKLACILLGILLLIFVLTIHLPAVIGAENMQTRQMAITPLLKDIALMGAA